MSAAIDNMVAALRAKCGFDPAELNATSQLRILARVTSVDNWRVVMQRLKAAELKRTWSLDLSQLYFLKTQNERAPLVKGWRVILKADDLPAACEDITRIVQNAPVARVTLDEVVLPGGGVHRNYSTANGKGAQMISGGGSGGPALGLFPRGGG